VTDATTATVPEPYPPGIDELQAIRRVTGREVGMRKSVYPRWVKGGRMTPTTAEYEQRGMGMALGLARGMLDLWPQLTAMQQHDLRVAMIAGGREAQP
jgi:hypothetical protein